MTTNFAQYEKSAGNCPCETLRDLCTEAPTYWANSGKMPWQDAQDKLAFCKADTDDADARLRRFAPFIARVFPETAAAGGVIESELRPIDAARAAWAADGPVPAGKLLLKMDSHLAVAGSVKARGGIYEVLKHTEDLALANGLLAPGDTYAKLADSDARAVFSKYTVQVGSTGNLGLSIGISSAVVGFHAVVHMSADAKQWKKDKLRSMGVDVREYSGDYGLAVAQGRAASDADPTSYFVDDEHSTALFLGYSVAGRRLHKQLDDMGITVDAAHPLFVYLPCGVGGAPGGITFGLKQEFGDNVHCVFVEPTRCPCMLLGLASEKYNDVCVQDIGLSGVTDADGLAVARPSGMVAKMMAPLLDGCFTVPDSQIIPATRRLYQSENIFIEPSSCVAFDAWARAAALCPCADNPNAVHIVWATGGSMVPPDVRRQYLND